MKHQCDSFLLLFLVCITSNVVVEVYTASASGFSAVNGTSTTLTWTLDFPPGRTFQMFRVFEGDSATNSKLIARFVQGQDVVIGAAPELLGRISNPNPTRAMTSTKAISITIGPLTMKDNELELTYELQYDNFAAADLVHNTLEVTVKPYYCGQGDGLPAEKSVTTSEELKLSSEICGSPRPSISWQFPKGKFTQDSTATNTTGTEGDILTLTIPKLNIKDCGKQVMFEASNKHGTVNKTTTITVTANPPSISETGITAKKEKSGENICIRVEFSPVDVGFCDVTYTIRYDIPGDSSVNEDIGSTNSNLNCEGNVKNATNIYVRSNFQRNQGVFSTSNVTVKSLPPPTTTTTTIATTTTTPIKDGSTGGSDDTGMIAGVVVGVLILIIVIAVVVFFIVKKKNRNKSTSQPIEATETAPNYDHVPMDNYDGKAAENTYEPAPKSTKRPPEREMDPDQAVYASLGAAGGRQGPRPAPEPSNYAEVKVDDHGYPVTRRPGANPSESAYARPDEDFDDGVIV